MRSPVPITPTSLVTVVAKKINLKVLLMLHNVKLTSPKINSRYFILRVIQLASTACTANETKTLKPNRSA